MNRVDRTLVLAWSLLDLMPAPKTATGQLRAGQRREESAHHREPCPTCSASPTPGLVRDRFQRSSVCPTCGGAGRRWVDDLTGQPTNPPGHEARPLELPTRIATKRVLCDRCGGAGVHGWSEGRALRCDLCDGAGRIPVPIWADDQAKTLERAGDPVLTQLERRDRAGSWHELDVALARLRVGYPGLTRAYVDRHVVDGRPRTGDLEVAYRLVDRWMPPRIVVPGDVIQAYDARRDRAAHAERVRLGRLGRVAQLERRDERDDRIRLMAWQGERPEFIATQVGVSVATVRRVVNERSTGRPLAGSA